MAYTHYDRLTALDTTFLDLEDRDLHMHVGSLGIFEAGPLARADGGIDFEQISAIAEADLRQAPRFRQKLARIPVTGHPVWVDDDQFNLQYHLRHTSLPFPGDERRLKRLMGRIMSQNLDRSKPLWELWFVEGLEGGRFAVISKVHHCLIDDISGADPLAAFLGPDPGYKPEIGEHHWMPQPAPGSAGLLWGEITRRAGLPGRLARSAAQSLSEPRSSFDAAAHAASGLVNSVVSSLTPASETPFNREIGPHRRFDWTHFDLDAVRETTSKLGGSVNDLALACVAGAVREHLIAHGTSFDKIDFRALVPVSTRISGEHGKLGNRVSLLVAGLPVDDGDPSRRMHRVVEETSRLEESGQVEGAAVFEDVSDWTATALLTRFSRLAASRRAYNLIVTSMPGSDVPVYLAGSRMLAAYPLVPLFTNQGLGIALLNYDGRLHWGFNGDWDAVPDLHEFVLAVEREFETLRKL